ncbi:MAG: hypothetical protein HYZ28_03085 [Myxococcales bacterium]|nr:hypothetical protein [Myxococcales bacterium]
MTCDQCEALLVDRAAGLAAPCGAGELEAHLGDCRRCRTFAGAVEEALELSSLPPLSEAEREFLARLEEPAVKAYRRSLRRRSLAKRALWLSAAAALGATVASAFLFHRPQPAPAVAYASPEESWEVDEPEATASEVAEEAELAWFEIGWSEDFPPFDSQGETP